MSAGTPNFNRLHEMGKLPKEQIHNVAGAKAEADLAEVTAELAAYKEEFGELPKKKGKKAAKPSDQPKADVPDSAGEDTQPDEDQGEQDLSLNANASRKEMETFAVENKLLLAEDVVRFSNKGKLFAVIQERVGEIVGDK